MKKSDLVKHLAAETGQPQYVIDNVLVALNKVAERKLKANGEFSVHGFVTLKIKDKPQRKGRNPATGEAITIPARRVVVAKATALQTAISK